FRALFPRVGDLDLARSWAGRIDLTPDVIPIIDQPAPRLFVAAGFSGQGVALRVSTECDCRQRVVKCSLPETPCGGECQNLPGVAEPATSQQGRVRGE